MRASKDWLPELVVKARTLKGNAGHEAGTDVGPVVSRAAKARILGLIEAGVKEGAKLVLDGRSVKVPGSLIVKGCVKTNWPPNAAA